MDSGEECVCFEGRMGGGGGESMRDPDKRSGCGVGG